MNVLGVVFAVSVACATASDVGSLMQVGVKGHASQGMTFALSNLENELSNLPLSNSGDKLAINAVLSGMHDSLDSADTNEILQNVSLLLEQIKTNLKNTRDAEQLILDAVNPALAACNVLWNTEDGIADTAQSAAKTTHDSCRVTEGGLFDTDAAACGALTSYLLDVQAQAGVSGTSSGWCVDRPSSTALSQRDAWQTYLLSGSSQANAVVGNLADGDPSNHKGQCLAATKALEDQIQTCDAAQHQYGLKFCEFRIARQTRCSSQSTCYTTEQNAYLATKDAKESDSDTRKAEVALVSRIQCLIDNLVLDPPVTDIAACNPPTGPSQTLSDYHAVYGNDFPTLVAAAACDLTAVAVYPGTAGWSAFAGYDALPAKTPADGTSACST